MQIAEEKSRVCFYKSTLIDSIVCTYKFQLALVKLSEGRRQRHRVVVVYIYLDRLTDRSCASRFFETLDLRRDVYPRRWKN